MKHIFFVAMILGLVSLASCGDADTQSPESSNTPDVVIIEATDDEIEDVKEMMEENQDENEDEKMMKNEEDNEETAEDTMQKDDESMMQDEKAMESSGGTYTTYSPDLVGQTPNTVLFFSASWCPSCRALDSALSSEDIPADTTILKVDYDTATDLKKQYGVVTQHTLVAVGPDGTKKSLWVGGSGIDSIMEHLN